MPVSTPTAPSATATASPASHAYNDPTRQNWAFGHRAIPKLIGEVQSNDEALQLQALHSLTCRLHEPVDVQEALVAGAVPAISQSLSHAKPLVRARAVEIVVLLTEHEQGRAAVLGHSHVETLIKLIADPEEDVRGPALQALWNVSQRTEQVQQIYSTLPHVIDHLLRAVTAEKSRSYRLLARVLETLHHFFHHGGAPVVAHTLKLGALTTLTKLLKSHVGGQAVRAAAAEDLAAICIHVTTLPDVAKQAHDASLVPVLVETMDDPFGAVRAAAVQAAMALSIHVASKQQLVAEGVAEKLVRMVSEDQDEELLMNALTAIASISEDYTARYTFQDVIGLIEQLKAHPNRAVAKAAASAVQVVQWRP
ncbi:Radial spoke head 14 [Allomyces arbusculus]|nr:Radial spoke head 14 [Allomyces arbusculus]